MAYDFKSERDVKEYIRNIGTEYRYGCYSERNPEACHLLGDYMEAINKDYRKAGKLYRNNCDDHNYGRSCLKYGTYALLGKGGVPANPETSLAYFGKACDLNIPEACFNHGMLMVSPEGRNLPGSSIPKSLASLEKGCTGNNPNACYYLSSMYITGVKKQDDTDDTKSDKVVYDLEKDMNKAFKFTLMGCNLQNIYCCVNLSQMYARGQGVEKNQELADKYKTMALELQSDAMDPNRTLTFQQGLP